MHDLRPIFLVFFEEPPYTLVDIPLDLSYLCLLVVSALMGSYLMYCFVICLIH